MVTAETAFRHDGGISIHQAAGHVADGLAAAYDKVYLCAPTVDCAPQSPTACTLRAKNIELIPAPAYTGSLGALRHPLGIMSAYLRLGRKVDGLFIRGMAPYIAFLYFVAAVTCHKTCHWIIANNVGLLRSHRRAGRLMDALSMAYALQDRWFTRLGRWVTRGSLICNGEELGDIYRSPRTTVTASSTITNDDFHERADTCEREKIRILFVGAIRPEKGVEYLFQAVGHLQTSRPWELVLVGREDQFPEYRKRLGNMAAELGITPKLDWKGYVQYGPDLFRCMREADILVLPSLSEGTPHVLSEARASSLPIVSTNVGGIPSTVTDGEDALLVPSKDPQAIAEAIDRIVEDGNLRRSLIQHGFRNARELTLDHFVGLIVESLGGTRRHNEHSQ